MEVSTASQPGTEQLIRGQEDVQKEVWKLGRQWQRGEDEQMYRKWEMKQEKKVENMRLPETDIELLKCDIKGAHPVFLIIKFPFLFYVFEASTLY